MHYEIKDKTRFSLLGKGIEIAMQTDENITKIPAFWGECHQNGLVSKLAEVKGLKEIVGACLMPESPDATSFTYAVAALTETPAPQEGLDLWEVPALTWAIFESVGPLPHAIQAVWKEIYTDWFPTTGFEHGPGPELEVYPPGDTSAATYRCEIWIPILKK